MDNKSAMATSPIKQVDSYVDGHKESVRYQNVSEFNSTLCIDFLELFGYPSFLKINNWHQGIDWCLFVVNEVPESREYLVEAPYPLESLAANPKYQEWYKCIPENIRHQLKRYPEMGFSLLYHINHYQAAYDLFISSPTLLWFFLRTAKSEKWTENKVISLLNGKRTNILAACGLPASNAALKLMNNFDFDVFCIKKFWKIKEAYELGYYAKLNHHKKIDFTLFSVLIRFPELIGSSLMNHYSTNTWKANVDLLLQDIKLISAQLDEQELGTIRLRQCKNLYEANLLHDRLIIKLNKRSIDYLPENNFSLPPFLGTEHIIPITGSKELAIEGLTQHHCVRSYENKILDGNYYVYRILQPERATLGIRLNKKMPPTINQLFLSWNKPVSRKTRTSIDSWLLVD